MDNNIVPKKGCSLPVKIILFISILLNILVIAAVAYGYGLLKSLSSDASLTMPVNETSQMQEGAEPIPDHPLLNAEQEKALQSAGVDVGSLPSEITPEMEDCFTEKVGAARVAEIKAGSQVTPMDFLKAKSCL